MNEEKKGEFTSSELGNHFTNHLTEFSSSVETHHHEIDKVKVDVCNAFNQNLSAISTCVMRGKLML